MVDSGVTVKLCGNFSSFGRDEIVGKVIGTDIGICDIPQPHEPADLRR